MRLRDYLEDIKVGRGNIIVVSDNDGNAGYDNYMEGKYFDIGSNWDLVYAEDLIEEHGEFFGEWLERDIVEVDAPQLPIATYYRWLDRCSDYYNPEWMEQNILVIVEGYDEDDEYWNEDTMHPVDKWPFEQLSEKKYQEIEDFINNGVVTGPNEYEYRVRRFIIYVIPYFLKWGYDYCKELDEDIEEEYQECIKRNEEEKAKYNAVKPIYDKWVADGEDFKNVPEEIKAKTGGVTCYDDDFEDYLSSDFLASLVITKALFEHFDNINEFYDWLKIQNYWHI